MKGSKERTFSILDIETARFGSDILEIGIIRIDNQMNILDEIEIRTNIPYPEKHVSGIIPSEAPPGKYTPKEAIEILRDIIKYDTILGWNLSYETRVLKPFNMVLYKKTDLMQLFRRIFKLQKYSLDYVCSRFKIESNKKHRALGDCHRILELMRKVPKVFKYGVIT